MEAKFRISAANLRGRRGLETAGRPEGLGRAVDTSFDNILEKFRCGVCYQFETDVRHLTCCGNALCQGCFVDIPKTGNAGAKLCPYCRNPRYRQRKGIYPRFYKQLEEAIKAARAELHTHVAGTAPNNVQSSPDRKEDEEDEEEQEQEQVPKKRRERGDDCPLPYDSDVVITGVAWA